MGRKLIIFGVVAVVVLILAAVAAVFGWMWYSANVTEQELARAEKQFEEGLWGPAKGSYARYMSRVEEYPPRILEKYARASLNIMNNRSNAIRDAGTAYFQIARDSGDWEDQERVLELYKKYGMWEELAYVADFFLEADADHEHAERLRYEIAFARDRQGSAQIAIRAYEELIEKGASEYPEAYVNLARLLMEQGLEARAENLLAQGAEAAGDDPDFYTERARFKMMHGEGVEAAMEDARKALEQDPDNKDALVLMSSVLTEQGEYDRAIELGKRAAEIDSALAEAHVAVMSAYIRQDERDAARDYLLGLNEMTLANHEQLLLSLGEIQVAMEDFEGAAETKKLYRRAYPDSRIPLMYLEARQLLAQNDEEKALELLTQVVESSPNFPRGRMYQAMAFIRTGNRERGRVALSTYLTNNPADEQARQLYDRLFGAPPTPEEALADAETALGDPDASAADLVRYASRLMNSQSGGNEETVANLLRRAIERAPEMGDAYRLLAILRDQAGDSQQALAVLREAEEAGVAADELRQLRAALELEEGKLEAAKALLAEDMDAGATSAEDRIAWAGIFGRYGYMDESMSVLDMEAAESADDRLALGAAQTALLLEFESRDAALARYRELDLPIEGPLATQTVELAAAFLRSPADVELARELVQEVLSADADHRGARILTARFHLMETPPDTAAAEQVAQEVLENAPGNADALLVLHSAASAKGQWSKALEYAREAADQRPEAVPPRIAAADSLLKLGQYEQARSVAEDLLQQYPDLPEALHIIGRAQVISGNIEEARETLAKLEEQALPQTQSASLADDLQRLLILQGSGEGGLEELRAAYQQDPSDVDAARSLASLMVRQGQPDEAVGIMQSLVERQSGDPAAWQALGNFYSELGGDEAYAKATQAFSQTLGLMPDYAPALRGMADVQMQMGNAGLAIGFLDRYLGIQPEDRAARLQRAQVLWRQSGDAREALDYLEDNVSEDRDGQYYALSGLLQVEAGDYRAGLADLVRAEEQLNELPADMEAALAWAHLQLNNRSAALEHFRQAQEKYGPERSRTERRMQRLEEQLGSTS